MADPWDKGSDSTNQLPNAELNPLLNPILGQNLDRWAEVYFTNPPEKREQAVLELLRELQGGVPATPPPGAAAKRNVANDAESGREVLCPNCQQVNRGDQQFCGMCGWSLQLPDAQYGRVRASSETPVPPAPAPAENDLPGLPHEDFAADVQATTGHALWKYLVVGFALLLASFGYLERASRSPRVVVPANPPASSSQPQTQAVTPPQPPAQPPQPKPSEPARKLPLVEPALATHENVNQPPLEATLSSPAQKLAADADSAAAATDGTQELLLAQHYLEGNAGSRDTTEAAKWLWKAVGKQNTSAVVLLADLYLRGDGVPKSCDQARLLLLAAAKKGASQAAEKLRSPELTGCR